MDGNTMRRNRARYREIVCSLDIDIQLLVTSNNNRFKVLLRGWKKNYRVPDGNTRWKEDFIDLDLFQIQLYSRFGIFLKRQICGN